MSFPLTRAKKPFCGRCTSDDAGRTGQVGGRDGGEGLLWEDHHFGLQCSKGAVKRKRQTSVQGRRSNDVLNTHIQNIF